MTCPEESASTQGTNWYKRLFAWMMATATAEYEQAIAPRKQTLFANLKGSILEIGPGAGVNLRYLNPQVHWIGLEPNPHMHPYLQREADALGLKIDLRRQSAETSGLAEASIDTVISTLVLCSVPNLSTALQDIHRVLKPGGRFVFIEHVAAPPGSLLRQIQFGIRPFWQLIGDGCCPNRDIGAAIAAAGFAQIEQEAFDGPVPIAIVRPHIMGIATKSQNLDITPNR